ncbi:MAG: PEP-CTERM sorting domain-containing protein [Phycisphaerae bacterium]
MVTKSGKALLSAALLAAGFAAVGTAQASVVDIQFLVTGGNTATSFSGSQGAYTGDSLTAPTWNVINTSHTATSGAASNLVASNGTVTTENVSFTMTGGYVSTATTTFGNGGGTNDLLQSYLLNNPGTGTVTLTGLADGGNYQLYLYSGSGSYNNAATNFAITTGSGSAAAGSNGGVVNVANGNLAFTENTNYVVFNATADATGTLAISYTGAPGKAEADINGLQVIATPEPATMGLVTAGALGLLLVGRKRKTA